MSPDADPRTTPALEVPVVRPITARELAFYAICRAITVGFSRLYCPGRVVGREHLPESGPYILAPLHRSYADWLLVARVTRRRLRYIVKGEVWRSRFVGRLLELLGAFPINRGAADREALHHALEVLSAGEPLVVFPEGTRGNGPDVGEIRDGASYLAQRAKVPIVPVGLAGAEHAMPRGAWLPRPTRVVLVVGEAIYPHDSIDGRRRSRSETRELSEELRASLQRCYGEATDLLTRQGHGIRRRLGRSSSETSERAVRSRERKKRS